MSNSLDFLRKRRSEVIDASSARNSFNILIYGEVGTGKSTILSTCRLPLYVMSFDPGGTKIKCLETLSAAGNAILDDSCEREDSKSPVAFRTFDRIFNDLEKSKAFESLGTFAIDSLTTMADAAMNFILQREGRPGTTPQIQDYLVQQTLLKQVFRKCCNLPCDFVLTGHIDTMRDEVTGRIITSLMVPGKASTQVPLLFDEVLLTHVEMDAKKNPVYSVRLVGDVKYKASTRRFSGEGFEVYEKPDLMRLRAMSGFPVEHLNPLT